MLWSNEFKEDWPFYYLSFAQAVHFPIRVSSNVKVGKLGHRNAVKIAPGSRIVIGDGESFGLGNRTYWEIQNDGIVVFDGNAIIGRGTQIISKGKIHFGNDFFCNAGCIINAGKEIRFGDDCIIGWNVEIIDGDGHEIIKDNLPKALYKSIHVGNHVWIGSNSMVLKGSIIPDNCIVGAKSCITKSFDGSNLLICEQNRVKAKDINWRR